MSDIPFSSAKQLASMIRTKKIGALELLDLYLQRVECYSEINAIIFMDVDAARKRARQADRALARGTSGALFTGCP